MKFIFFIVFLKLNWLFDVSVGLIKEDVVESIVIFDDELDLGLIGLEYMFMKEVYVLFYYFKKFYLEFVVNVFK